MKRQADDVEMVPIGSLKFDPENARGHDERNLSAIRVSIAEHGIVAPVVVDKRTRIIIGGNATTRVATEMGATDIGVSWVDCENATERRKLAVRLNRTGELATWKPDQLGAQLAEWQAVEGVDWDPEAYGFDPDEASGFVSAFEGPSPVEEPEPEPEPPPENPDSQAGEVYQLGPHRLLCGDCRDPEDVARLLDGCRVNVAFTSPPYASQRKYDESSGFKPIAPDDYVAWFDAVQENVRAHLAEDGSWFVNIKEAADDGQKQTYVKRLTIRHVDEWGWKWIEEFCWSRPALPLNPNMSRRFKNGWESVYHFAASTAYKFNPDDVRHETDGAFIYADQKAAGKMVGGTAQGVGGGIMSPVNAGHGLAFPSNVLSNMGGAKVVGHSAAFPVGLPDFFIRAYSDAGDAIFDPFMGSGSTLIAAAKNERIGYGLELSPGYCDVIRRRWTRWALGAGHEPGPGALHPDDGV